MSWKDYFYFSKTERNGITVLIIIIIAILLYPIIRNQQHKGYTYNYESFRDELEQYNTLLAEYVSAKEAINTERQRTALPVEKLTPYPFNPNEASKEELMEMGLRERIASNIINYRNAGGRFRFKEDLNRIFSINDEIYAQLEPFIQLPLRPQESSNEIGSRSKENHQVESEKRNLTETPGEKRTTSSFRASLLVDINQADTVRWQQIRGIGPVFSRRIVAYRELLGGYYSTDQIREVFGMDSSRFESIASHIIIHHDSLYLRKININESDFATLLRHPYLNRNQVNSIIRIRELHGPFENIGKIKRSDLINDDDFQKIAPYLSVD